MRHTLRFAIALGLAAMVGGCAGGWRNGPPAGEADAPIVNAARSQPTATSSGNVTFTYAGDGQSVHVAGDFNEWSTTDDPMIKQGDGTWQLEKSLAPGRYGYKFVIDGGTWEADPNATETVDDGFGGQNSIVVVGAGSGAPAAAGSGAGAGAGAGAAAAASGAGGKAVFAYSGSGQTVHVAGDFNEWSTSADAMTQQADGTWKLEKALAPGRYAYKFVVDGGTWTEDPKASETVDDGFGGQNAIIVVGAGGGGGTAATTGAGAAAALAAGAAAVAPQSIDGGVRFTYAGTARTVHLCGDFNAWSTSTDPLELEGGLWTIVKPIEAGTYKYKFLIDGKTWKQDAANPETTDDGFGGLSSVVTIE